MLVFSLGCEKSNSRCTRELSYSRGETYNSHKFLLPLNTRFTLLSVQPELRLLGKSSKKTSQELGNCPMGQREALLKERFYQTKALLK